jgi:hypothetical protein
MADEGTGYGQQSPGDSANAHNSDIFKIQQEISRVSTAKIVQVMAVNADKQTVDVQIMVNQTDGAGNATPHGTIYGIPYSNRQDGKTLFKSAPVVGDKGVMVVIDRDISAVKNTKKISPPGSSRRFDVSDGIYLGGMQALSSETPDQTIEITAEGAKATLKHGNILEAGTTGWAFTGNVTFKNNIQLAGSLQSDTGGEYGGDLKTSGDVVAGTISLKSHRTSGVTTGTGISGAPVV